MHTAEVTEENPHENILTYTWLTAFVLCITTQSSSNSTLTTLIQTEIAQLTTKWEENTTGEQ